MTTHSSSPGDLEARGQAARHDPVYDRLAETAEFQEVRRRTGMFVIPATAIFLGWYLLYVLMSNWAHDVMSHRVFGHVNVALIFGLLQFVSTFLIAGLYARHMNNQVDDLAHELDVRYNEERTR
ncbi:uncharacterized membrane protein (DUF485 family) [Marmoricola sp. URHA0025 HA25]